MPIVNYVREHTRFIEYASDEHLTASERLLWYALMHIMNGRAQGRVWPGEYIRINNDRLLSLCPMKYDTLAQARNSLKQRGLIDFEKGVKNKLSPAYKMIYFYPEYVAPDTESDADYPLSNTEKSEYMGGYMGGNTGGYMGGKPGGYMGDFNINQNVVRERNQKTKGEEEEDTTTGISACARKIKATWKENYGEEPTPGIVRCLEERMKTWKFDEDVIIPLIETACLAHAASPIDYILTVGLDMHYYGVRDEEDAREYLDLYEARKGKRDYLSVSQAIDEMDEMRERNKRRNKLEDAS